ncbi:MAG: 50S ribosomal protein L30 [Candidatus Diapherotrites archaeon]|nr:50S ribosomal protein L30 [Candidatus Diapherotrites archaeon]
MNRIAVVMVKGLINTPQTVKDTLKMINLTKVNHCVVIDDRKEYKGMLQKAKDCITWGEVSGDIVVRLLDKRGRIVGDRKLSEEWLKDHNFKSIQAFADSFMKFEAELRDLDVKPVFRLGPPKKGYKTTKKTFRQGGDLGYRGEAINDLLARMVR